MKYISFFVGGSRSGLGRMRIEDNLEKRNHMNSSMDVNTE